MNLHKWVCERTRIVELTDADASGALQQTQILQQLYGKHCLPERLLKELNGPWQMDGELLHVWTQEDAANGRSVEEVRNRIFSILQDLLLRWP